MQRFRCPFCCGFLSREISTQESMSRRRLSVSRDLSSDIQQESTACEAHLAPGRPKNARRCTNKTCVFVNGHFVCVAHRDVAVNWPATARSRSASRTRAPAPVLQAPSPSTGAHVNVDYDNHLDEHHEILSDLHTQTPQTTTSASPPVISTSTSTSALSKKPNASRKNTSVGRGVSSIKKGKTRLRNVTVTAGSLGNNDALSSVIAALSLSKKRSKKKSKAKVGDNTHAIRQPDVVHIESTMHLDPGRGRSYMEDRALVTTIEIENSCLPGTSTLSFVCDGHGGHTCAEYVIQYFPSVFMQVFNELRRDNDVAGPVHSDFHIATPARGILHSVLELAKSFDRHSRIHNDTSGSTLTGTLIHHATSQQWLFNLGDSRTAVIDAVRGHVILETRDHKPDSPIEIERVERRSRELSKRTKGRDSITIETERGDCARLEGKLAMTRAIGDNDGSLINKVDREPDIFMVPYISEPYLTIMASDGVWDVMDPRGKGSHGLAGYCKQNVGSNLTAFGLVERVKHDPLCADNLSAIILNVSPVM